ncbi:MAG TPA: serine hydrolase [Gemmatimonadales bacterium]|nr:serine hydrolase [Gemmatimonadales bacterium]
MTRPPVRARLLLPVLSLLPAVLAAQPRPAAPPPGFDALVEEVRRTFEIPGLAVAIVKDGQVVLARGYGIRRQGNGAPVDQATHFGIASNTKAFTALALGLLVEEGKVEWDAPVTRYLPEFQLWDPWVTRELTVRDLLVHRSGFSLGAGDLLWWPPTTYDRPEIMRRLRFIKPATSFRSAYAYDNVLYLVAGQLIERMSGTSWEEFVTARLLRPVGMSGASVLHSAASDTAGNVAGTHAKVDGRMVPVKPFLSDNTNPAGGINAGAADMAHWLIAQLDSGRVGDGRLWSQRTARELWEMVVPIRPGSPPPALAPARANFNGYALGFFVRDWRGKKLVTHTGGLPGYISRVAMIPELKLGVAVLQNAEAPGHDILAWTVLDHYLGARHDWLGAYAGLWRRADSVAIAARTEAAAARDSTTRPSLPLARYAGTWRDDWYGDVAIAAEGDGLAIRFSRSPDLVGDLVHWQYDTFLVRWRDRTLRADAYISFALDEAGRAARATMKPASDEVDFSFDFQDLALRRVDP